MENTDSGLNSRNFIDLLLEYQMSIGYLYDLYASILSEYRELWSSMAEAQMTQIGWITELQKMVDLDVIHLNLGEFNETALSTAIRYVKEEISKAQTLQNDMLTALVTSSYLEKAFWRLMHSNYSKPMTVD